MMEPEFILYHRRRDCKGSGSSSSHHSGPGLGSLPILLRGIPLKKITISKIFMRRTASPPLLKRTGGESEASFIKTKLKSRGRIPDQRA